MIRTSGDNAICISGRVQGDAMLDHELYGEAFYSLYLEVPRLSGAVDILPVTLPAGSAPSFQGQGRAGVYMASCVPITSIRIQAAG